MTHPVSTKRLSSGKYIDLAKLSVNDIHIDDIDRSLNYIYRFTGHWKDDEPLTVAQHTRLVVRLAGEIFPDDPLAKLDCMVHDFPEAYTGDIATPLKKLFGTQFKDYEGQIEDVVYKALYEPVAREPLTKEVYELRKVCDLMALDIERRAIWRNPNGKSNWPTIPKENEFSVPEKLDLYKWAKKDRFVDLKKMYNEIAEETRPLLKPIPKKEMYFDRASNSYLWSDDSEDSIRNLL